MEELLQILNKLEENTNLILLENKRLENEIRILKGEEPVQVPELSYDGGLLGDLREAKKVLLEMQLQLIQKVLN